MKVVVLQSNYIPWKGYFHLIEQADLFIFYDEVQYTKNDWRNRNRIYSKNGLQWLTIPVGNEAANGKISEVKLHPEKWQDNHFKSLTLNYKPAPHFKQLQELATDYLAENKWTSLKELNHYLIKKIAVNIGIKTEFRDSTEYDLSGDKVTRLMYLLKQAGCTEYISGPAGKSYLEPFEQQYRDHGIAIRYMSYPQYPVYPQLKPEFETAVSILDMVAHLPYNEIGNYIWGSK